MRKLAILGALAVMVTPASALAGTAKSDAQKQCRAERTAMGTQTFRDTYGTNKNKHNAFGYGVHFCLGAALSRAEVRETLRQLLPQLTEWRLDSGPPAWRISDTFRALENLRLVSPATRF